MTEARKGICYTTLAVPLSSENPAFLGLLFYYCYLLTESN